KHGLAQPLKAFWRLPSMTVARFTLVSYIRSGWILGDVVLVWLLYALFFLEFGGNVAYFFVISTLIVTFSAPIATRRARILLLAWFAAVIYSNTNPGPVAAVLGVTRIPLIPLATCYSFGATGSIGWSGVGALLMMVRYVVGLTLGYDNVR